VFKKKFLENFQISNYNDQDIVYYNQILKENFSDSFDSIKEEFSLHDTNKTGFITFSSFRSVLENQQIQLEKDILEYLIYIMKKFEYETYDKIDDNDYLPSLYDLKYGNFLEIINEKIFININKDFSNLKNDINIKDFNKAKTSTDLNFISKNNSQNENISNSIKEEIIKLFSNENKTEDIYKDILNKILIEFLTDSNLQKINKNYLNVNNLNYYSIFEYFLSNLNHKRKLNENNNIITNNHINLNLKENNSIDIEPENLFKILNINLTDIEKIIVVENTKTISEKNILDKIKNDKNFSYEKYMVENIINFSKFQFDLLEISIFNFRNSVNENLSNNCQNKFSKSEKIIQNNYTKDVVILTKKDEEYNLKNNLLIEIIDLNSNQTYKNSILIIKNNFEKLYNLILIFVVGYIFKEVEKIKNISNSQIEQFNLISEIRNLNLIKELFKDINQKFYAVESNNDFSVISNIFRFLISYQALICKEDNKNLPFSAVLKIIFNYLENESKTKNVRKTISDIVNKNFDLLKFFFEINPINRNLNTLFSDENPFKENLFNIFKSIQVCFNNISLIIEKEMLRNNFSKNERVQDYNYIYNLALKEIIENMKLDTQKNLENLFEETLFSKIKTFKSIFIDEEKFILLLNSFVNISNYDLANIKDNFQVNRYKNDTLQNLEKQIHFFRRNNEKIKIGDFIQFCKQYDLFNKLLVLLCDIPIDFYCLENVDKNDHFEFHIHIQKIVRYIYPVDNLKQINSIIPDKGSLENCVSLCKIESKSIKEEECSKVNETVSSIQEVEHIKKDSFNSESGSFVDNEKNFKDKELYKSIDFNKKINSIKTSDKNQGNILSKASSKCDVDAENKDVTHQLDRCLKEKNLKNIKEDSFYFNDNLNGFDNNLLYEDIYSNNEHPNEDVVNKLNENLIDNNLNSSNNQRSSEKLNDYLNINQLIIIRIKKFLICNSSKFINSFDRLFFLIQTKIKISECRREMEILDLYEFLINKKILEENFLKLNLKKNFIKNNITENVKKFLPSYSVDENIVNLENLKHLVENKSLDDKLERIDIESKENSNFVIGGTLYFI